MGVHVPATESQDARGSGRLRELARHSTGWPAGRVAAVVVVVGWVVIAAAVRASWVNFSAAAFLAAGWFTFVIVLLLAYDAAVDWADPDEHEPPVRRLQPEQAWPVLQGAAGLLRVWSVPVCFVAGVVVGHFEWH